MAAYTDVPRPLSLLDRLIETVRSWEDHLALAHELRELDPEGARRLLQKRGLIRP